MQTIENKKEDTRQKIRILDKKDLTFSYYAAGGCGGQAKNKIKSGCMIQHKESGSSARASDSRSLEDNRQSAFQKLLKTPQMKFWLAKRIYEINQQTTIEEEAERDMALKNLKFEIKNEAGQWTETSDNYFNSPAALEII